MTITLEKAIKDMEDEAKNIPVIPHSELHSAHLLGIEALKRVEHTRHEGPEFIIPLLPGETKE